MSVDFSRFFWKWSAPAAAAVGDMLKRELMRHAKRLTGLFESFEEAFRTGTRGEFWVPISEVSTLFYSFEVCRITSWDSLSIKGQFIRRTKKDNFGG